MRKKLLFALVALMTTIGTLTSCDNEDAPIAFDALPAAAQTMISTYFDKEQVLLISYEKEFLNHEYTVLFNDGTTIEFNKEGVWESIDAETTGVPAAILPTNIATYLEANYADRKVTEISKETKGYDVEIENLIELEFDTNGNFVRVDV